MSQIRITHLTFSYEGSYDNILEDVNLQLDTDWRLGLTGRNGRGKTTFLRLLQGLYEYEGNISSGVSFEYFPYVVENMEQMTLDVVRNVCKDFEDWELIRELNLLSVDEDVLYRPFSTLSSGERTKVLLAAMFLKETSFLLIDEPTDHLDLEARRIVSRYLSAKKGFILVSHDRTFLDNSIDHILSINRSGMELRKGNFTSWWNEKEIRDRNEAEDNERLRKEIGRLKDSARQTRDWSDKVEKTKIGTRNSGSKPDKGYIGHMAAKMMKRSKSIEARKNLAIEEKSKLFKDTERTYPLKISQLDFHSERLVSLEDVSIRYGERTILSGFSLEIRTGERIALTGRNGSGKSSLLKLICGNDIDYTGKLWRGADLKVSFVSQDTSHLKGSIRDYCIQNEIDEALFRAILQKLGFDRVQFEKEIEDYSSGQKKKVLIAGSICEKAHLHVWDEPLNFIDVFSRIQIENLLLEYKPTIIFVEHDSAFCGAVATRAVSLP